MSHRIRLARPPELPALQEIEDVAGRLYSGAGLPADLPGLPLQALKDALRQEMLWVVAADDDRPVGFALCWLRPGALHLRELDVLPEQGRRGLGTRLLSHVAEQAVRRALPQVTLTTFRDIPWNAPFYARRGFQPLSDGALPGWLSAIRAQEVDQGLDRWPRLAMHKPL